MNGPPGKEARTVSISEGSCGSLAPRLVGATRARSKFIVDQADELQPDSETVFGVVPLVSSYHALNAVLAVEKIVGYEIPDSVVMRGGYQDCEEFVKHMMRKLAAYHAKH